MGVTQPTTAAEQVEHLKALLADLDADRPMFAAEWPDRKAALEWAIDCLDNGAQKVREGMIRQAMSGTYIGTMMEGGE